MVVSKEVGRLIMYFYSVKIRERNAREEICAVRSRLAFVVGSCGSQAAVSKVMPFATYDDLIQR